MDLNIAFRRSLLATTRRAVIVRRRPRHGLLHTSTFLFANPVPFPTTAEPPPPPPEPARVQPNDRIDRKRRQAELLQKGREIRSNPSRPVRILQKRFWRNVTVEETSGTLFGELNLGDFDAN
jgi:ATP synthase F1 complex assembly factor 2